MDLFAFFYLSRRYQYLVKAILGQEIPCRAQTTPFFYVIGGNAVGQIFSCKANNSVIYRPRAFSFANRKK